MPKNYHLHLRGTVGSWNFDSEYTSYILDKHKDSDVNVIISSLGGDADSGLKISSLFKIHGNVNVHFIGMNASAATIAAMGAKHISIDAGACFLVHKCLNVVFDWDWMNADQLETRIKELQKLKDDLNTLDTCIAGIYARRCKKPKDELLQLMKVGGWLTPQQALEWGFVDEITDLEEDEKPVLTEAVASAICSAGMPMPPLQVEKGSFLERLRKFFMGSESPADRPKKGDTEFADNTQPQNNTPMKKFSLLAALLGAELTLAESKATVTEEQLDSIEASLASKDDEIKALKDQLAEKDTKMAELNSTIEDLKKTPAADSTEVKDQKTDADTDGPGDDIDSVVAALSKAYRS